MKSCEATGSFRRWRARRARCNICFKFTHTVTPESYEDFIRIFVPKMQARGIYKTSYEEGTLREKVVGEGARLGSLDTGTAFFRDLWNRSDLLTQK
jgi:hypothetical protein